MHTNKESVFSVLRSYRIPARLLILLLLSALLHVILAAVLVRESRKPQEIKPFPHNVVMIQLGRAPASKSDISPVQQRALPPPNQSQQQLPATAPDMAPQPALPKSAVVVSVQHNSPPQAALPPSAAQQTKVPTGRATEQHNQEERPQQGEAIFGSAGAPAFSKQAPPVYPPLARRRGREGSVLLRLHISKNGQLTRAEVLEDPGHGFAEAALEAVHASHFSPGHLHGKQVAMKALLTIRFTLR